MYMASPTDLKKKRTEQRKQAIVDLLLRDKDPKHDVVYLDPYIILYQKTERAIQILRLGETGIEKIFQDPK
jgi:hypothetical protein